MQFLLSMPAGAEWLLVILVLATFLAFAGFWSSKSFFGSVFLGGYGV